MADGDDADNCNLLIDHKLLLKILGGKENLWCLNLSVYFLVKIMLFLLALETWT